MSKTVIEFLTAHDEAVAAVAAARAACEKAHDLASTPEVQSALVAFAATVDQAPNKSRANGYVFLTDQQQSARRVKHGDRVRPTFPVLHKYAEFDSQPEADGAICFTNMTDGQEWHHVTLDVPRSALIEASDRPNQVEVR